MRSKSARSMTRLVACCVQKINFAHNAPPDANRCSPPGNRTEITNMWSAPRADEFLGGYPFSAPDSGRSRKGPYGNTYNNNYQYLPGDSFLNDPSQAQKTGTPLGTRPLVEPTAYSFFPHDFRPVCTDSCAGDRWGPRSRFWARVDKEWRSSSLSSRHC
jgi:hypothetical protein